MLLKVASKVTWASRAAFLSFSLDLSRGLVDANAAGFLQKANATAIAKLETDTDGKIRRINRKWLLLSLNLRDSAIGSMGVPVVYHLVYRGFGTP